MSTQVWPSNRDPYHGDIVQGRLGNCFLIASLQTIASCQPQLLKSIVSIEPLKCLFYRQGERVDVPMLTTEQLTKEQQYCRSTEANVQWPYIIEQAYAQFYGGQHENLAGGNTSEAFYDLLGQPVEESEPNETGLWEKIEKGLAERRILVTCGSVSTATAPAATSTANSLRINHAYGILATFIFQQTKEKYILIHNPQGINDVAKENLRARHAFFTNNSNNNRSLWSNTPGTQLLAWSQLRLMCNRIQICHLDVECRQTLQGEWTTTTSGGCSNFPTFYQNPLILLPPSCPKRLILVLGHTIDQRRERATTDVKLDYPQVGMTLIRFKSHTIPTHDNYEVLCQSKFWNKREIALNLQIDSQQRQLAVVISTYSPDVIASFWLQLFTKQPLPLVELRTWTSVFQQPVQTVRGEWHRENAGGRRNQSTTSIFHRNPAYRLVLLSSASVRFILHQSFSTNVPLARHYPIGIYVLNTTNNEDPVFVRARSVSRLVQLNAQEEHYIVPACFEPNSFGQFQLDVLCDVPFTLSTTESKMSPPSPSPPIARRTTTKKKSLNLAGARLSSMANDYNKLT